MAVEYIITLETRDSIQMIQMSNADPRVFTQSLEPGIHVSVRCTKNQLVRVNVI